MDGRNWGPLRKKEQVWKLNAGQNKFILHSFTISFIYLLSVTPVSAFHHGASYYVTRVLYQEILFRQPT
jgi:hypothetical protein